MPWQGPMYTHAMVCNVNVKPCGLMTWQLIVKFYCQSEVDQVRSSQPSMILPIDLHKLSKVQIDSISLFMHHEFLGNLVPLWDQWTIFTMFYDINLYWNTSYVRKIFWVILRLCNTCLFRVKVSYYLAANKTMLVVGLVGPRILFAGFIIVQITQNK